MYEHHWLRNSQVLQLLRSLRKRPQAEFDICLRLSDSDFERQLARAKAASVDAEPQRIIGLLEERRGAPFRSGDELAPAKYQRGQQVLREQPHPVPEPHRIYRCRFNRGEQS